MSNQVTITFNGVCAHFIGVVPGVPHRVVLPQTTLSYIGRMMLPGQDGMKCFTLAPHHAVVANGGSKEKINAFPGVIDDMIYTGVRMQIINACDEDLRYGDPTQNDTSIPDVPHIADYVDQYRYSENVVLGGRAKCYFDVFRGVVQSETLDKGAIRTLITMKTDGPPLLQITPLARSNDASQPWFVDVPVSDQLYVSNANGDCVDEGRFDFLWHFLTDQASLPLQLTKPLPGFDAKECDPAKLAESYRKLLSTGGVPDMPASDLAIIETSASCSNSQYP
ncbi:MAG TPA: hypothetical protein VIW45_13515 [Vicinamibacterales bacterium]|jgi:hypothetical protein